MKSNNAINWNAKPRTTAVSLEVGKKLQFLAGDSLKAMDDILKILILFFCLIGSNWGIVNPNNETAQSVIYLHKPSDIGPRTWAAGIRCLDQITPVYFKKRETLTRSPNLVMTVAINMSTPAAQIQDGYLKLLMEAVGEVPPKHQKYQMRIVSDAQAYRRNAINSNELVLADYYLLVVDSVWRLKNLMLNYVSIMLSWNPGARFLVLYNNAKNRNLEQETATVIFQEMLDSFYVHRVALLYATTPTSYSLLLMDYYNSSSCRTLNVKAFGECQEGQVTPHGIELQLDHFMNSFSLINCTFYMCASISAPFVEEDCIYGLEMRIIGFIKTRLKFNINQKCENESRGVEEQSGNWSGLLGRLNQQACDFILGGFYPDNDVIGSFWTSDTYLEDAYTWYVKLAAPRPAWRALYSIFKNMTWLAFIGMLGICWVVWSLVVNLLPEPKNSRQLSLTAINSLAASICVSVNERPLYAASRIFFFSVALYGMNLSSIYTSKLISVFTNPGYLHQISTLQEVIEEGIPFGGYQETRDWFENDDDMWIFKNFNYSSDFEPETMNLIHVKWGERVVLGSRMYILQSPLVDHVFAFPQNVFSSPMQMIMKAGFPFVYDFNCMIRFMRDFGLLDKINRDFVFNNTYLNRIATLRPQTQGQAIVLTAKHLQGPFAILMVGVCVSIVSLLGELVSFYIIHPYFCRCLVEDKDTIGNKEKNMPRRKRNRRIQARKVAAQKQKKTKSERKFKKSTEEIIVAWNEINGPRGVRLTPAKRRIIRN